MATVYASASELTMSMPGEIISGSALRALARYPNVTPRMLSTLIVEDRSELISYLQSP